MFSIKNLSPRLLKWVHQFQEAPVLVVGDLMVDRSVRGTVDRISPEAPVPVIDVNENTLTPGGAGNVVCNLAALGAKPTLLSVRGDDFEGRQIELEFEKREISVSHILVDPARPTITKTRVIAGHQQVVRYDVEKRGELALDLLHQITDQIKELVPQHRSVIISDYGKGLITPAVIQAALRASQRHRVPVVVDPKIEHFQQYKQVDCLTPNTKEAIEGMRAFPPKSEEEFVRLGWKILRKLRSHSLLITRGEKGMALFHEKGWVKMIPALAKEVFDVTGAGDTVVATFALARGLGVPHFEAAYLANLAASLVVAKVGTAVGTKAELIQLIRNL